MAQSLANALRVTAPLPLARGVADDRIVTDAFDVGVALALVLLDGQPLPLGEREALAQREACAERDACNELLTEEVDVGEGGGDREADVPVVLLPVIEAQGAADWLTQEVRVARRESDAIPLGDWVCVLEPLSLPLPEDEGEPEIEGEGKGVLETLDELEEVAQPVKEGELQGDGDVEEE